jgi:CDP-glucose 4,6-dehydratase
VFEPLSGYLTLAKHLYEINIENYEAWNFGPNTNDIYCVEDVVNLFYSRIGRGTMSTISKNRSESNSGHEAGLLQLNCDKAISKLGWTPRWSTEKAILETHDCDVGETNPKDAGPEYDPWGTISG